MPRTSKISLTVSKRADGRVCKKIGGRLRIWPNEETARRDLLAIIALQENPAALPAVAVADNAATLRDVFNAYVTDRQQLAAAGKIRPGSLYSDKRACETFIESIEKWRPAVPDVVSVLKRHVPVCQLQPLHFRHVRDEWSKRLGPWALTRNVVIVRSAFRWACEIRRLTPALPWWADEFALASKAERRADKKRREQLNGEWRFTSAELRAILGAASGLLRAWVLLALNCGMYSRDIASLRWRDIRRDGRQWTIDTLRAKTNVPQVAPLWPETVAALQAFGPGEADAYVFVTRAGRPYFTEESILDDAGRFLTLRRHDAIARNFARAIEPLSIKRAGVHFGAFRHTHVSATATHPDANARKVVRGHRIEGIEEHYDFADLRRLKDVTDLARRKLYTDVLRSKKRPASK